MGDDRPKRVRITLDLEPVVDPIRGVVDDGSGSARPFTGWLELMSALGNVLAAKPPGAGRRSPAARTASLARVEWEHIQRVLAECGGNVSETARRLRIHRRSLQRKMAKPPPRSHMK